MGLLRTEITADEASASPPCVRLVPTVNSQYRDVFELTAMPYYHQLATNYIFHNAIELTLFDASHIYKHSIALSYSLCQIAFFLHYW